MMKRETPVVILLSGHHGGLGIARSLGRLGVPIYCVSDNHWDPALCSRFCRGRFVLALENTGCVPGLLELGRNLGGRPILISTSDKTTSWVAENANALEAVFQFPHIDASLVQCLCDKSRMQELASQSGVPIARSMVPSSKEDVERFIETAVFPVLVKATDAERVRSRLGGTKFIVHSSRELLELYNRTEDPTDPKLMLQEFIPGEDWMFEGYFDQKSRCLFGATAKKIRRFPVNTGVTSLGVCLRNDTVERTTIEFMKAIGYQGILDIGYRCDQRDGKYRVLDVNPRIGCTFRLFTAINGTDVARALYLHMTGQPIAPAQAADGRKWMVEDFDAVSAFCSWRDSSLTLKDWLKSLRGVQETACFASDDPLPFFMMPLSDCFELYRRRFRSDSQKQGMPSLLRTRCGA